MVISMSRHLLVILWLLMYVAANARAADRPADFGHFWQEAVVRLQGWPVRPQWHTDSLSFSGPGLIPCQIRCQLQSQPSLPPVLYLTDRDDAELFVPGATHGWGVLDVRTVFAQHTASGDDPTVRGEYQAILLARRAVGLLVAHSAPAQVRVGLVGEGRGAAVALAVAAIYPEAVAFVAAYRPTVPSGSQPYLDPCSFGQDLKCPTLLSYPTTSAASEIEETTTLFEALKCAKELVPLSLARRAPTELVLWSELWRAWANETLGVAAPPSG
jgi:hypothetical protein